MKRLLKFKRLHLGLLGFLFLIILACLILIPIISGNAFIPSSIIKFWTSQNEQVLGFLENKGVFENSTADIFIEDGYLRINFNIENNDKLKVIEFNRRLGIGGDYLSGISVKLDADTIAKLQTMLPLKVNLDFADDKVTFSSKGKSLISPGFSGKSANISTGSGKLKYSAKDSQSFNLEIIDPEPVLQYATQSGSLRLSPKLNPMFPILQKIAKINVSMEGKSVTGEIILK